ncbi:1-deoxy-D-xylulose 5-phosphate reductoisomerase [Actinomyces bovis]|uniref:1-deoxy-D-xylulose 5-phosphate reductoisomerase n=1 Tax=Actinomyces bovis TaxID=1658 RepID=A0ABY1VKK8_9ACTO|nr:1-deoxy-D-xylulose-5-phosphate reductoisomerase [Actinomyces bovis]SPT52635.1 1-deoxy-D-xylulose 5-phosphate reductoisomerase [Actinomyces bovis]VEG54512.1 1-deoxy-D-xylulose 5-phosphate reductoisomerase [Actinomyces israelii]
MSTTPHNPHAGQATGPGSLVILGSTGSIGTQALEVLNRLAQDDLAPQVVGLAAGGSRAELIAQQAHSYQVPFLALADPAAKAPVEAALKALAERSGQPSPVKQVLSGPGAATELVSVTGVGPGDTVLNGITGSVGLLPTLAALRSGACLALANKESLVVGGALVKAALHHPGQVVPVDSEHSAIAQALLSGKHQRGLSSPVVTGDTEVRRLVLTASGGPFRGRHLEELAEVTAAQALAHPTWAMGPVVTVNSSTLINKGLELIEAHLLFDIPPEDIAVVVHPQSVIHSMVEFRDGATIAQVSPPDMRLPIALGLTWPRRPDLSGLVTPNDWSKPLSWDFEPLDNATFPAVGLARHAVATSATHPAVLNAANEQAVAAFLDGRLRWVDIVKVDAAVVESHPGQSNPTLEDVLAAETWARAQADALISKLN